MTGARAGFHLQAVRVETLERLGPGLAVRRDPARARRLGMVYSAARQLSQGVDAALQPAQVAALMPGSTNCHLVTEPRLFEILARASRERFAIPKEIPGMARVTTGMA